MARLYFFIAAATFVAVAFAKPEPIGFEIVDDIAKFGAENPGIKLQPVVTESGKKFHYTLGARQAGDRQISNSNNSNNNSSPRDFQTKLSYPYRGVGSQVITYVDITVEQSSDISNVYVTSGGIGQRQISILVEAKNTTYLSTKAVFYGI